MSRRALSPAEARVMLAITDERTRQLEKWGAQSHSPARWLAILAEEFGEAAKEATEEEFDSKASAKRQARLWAELVQTAAVAVAWLEDIYEAEPPHAYTDAEVGARCMGDDGQGCRVPHSGCICDTPERWTHVWVPDVDTGRCYDAMSGEPCPCPDDASVCRQ